MSLLDEAQAYAAAGLSVVPVAVDGTKRPAVPWKPYTTIPATPEQLTTWFATDTYDGLGIICGAVSGHLEMLEIEGRAPELVPALGQALTDHGMQDLWQRICSGYLEKSPSGGMHWLYRVDGTARGNTKLARRPIETGGVDVLIETRGEGGYTVAAPSAGRTHPTGRPWERLAGTPSTIPTLTVDERDALYAICGLFDQMPVPEPEPAATSSPAEPGRASEGLRPGDDYNQRATWDEILTPRGWTKTRSFGRRGFGWVRPGKKPADGISATTGMSDDDADRLYVFSTSTEFESERPYSKFAAYTLLEHAGDYAAAAKALSAAGYGDPIPEPPRLTLAASNHQVNAQSPDTGAVDGATVHQLRPGPTTYSLTDDGNALRLVDDYLDQIRYCPQRSQWLRWGGARWTWDEAEYVQELARTTARNLPTSTKADQAHRAKSLSARGVRAMMMLARSDERATIHLSALDARPFELNTPDGIVDLRTGTLNLPDPDALHTRSTSVAPQPGPAPRWEKFLADTFAGDPALTTYVQRLVGVSLIGTVLEQLLPFPFGSGANGKTTLLGVVQRLVGIGDAGYAISAPADMLLATQNAGHPTEIARLSGARLVVTSELEDGQRFAEAKVKQLTGRDVISGRFMRQDWFSFQPTHTLWLLANHQPEVRAGGPAFWRRIALLPFLHTVPPEERDAHLEDRLVDEEGPQILAWLIQGAVDYLTDGLARPSSVDVATDAYARDQDTVARFVDDCCDVAAPGTQTYAIASSKLRTEYENWCRQEGENPVPAKTLTLQLRSRFDVQSVRTMNARMLDGIRLKPHLNDDDDASSDASSDRPSDPWNLG